MPYQNHIPEPTPQGLDPESDDDVLAYYIAKQFYEMINSGNKETSSTAKIGAIFGISKGLVYKIADQVDRPGPKVWRAFEKHYTNGSHDELVRRARELWDKDVKEKGIVFTPKNSARERAMALARSWGVSEEVLKRIPVATPLDKDKTEREWWNVIQANEQMVNFEKSHPPTESPAAVQELLTRRLLAPIPPANPSSTKIKICK